MKTKYIQSENHPGISGFYYYAGDVYYKNVSAMGKIIVLVKPRKENNGLGGRQKKLN